MKTIATVSAAAAMTVAGLPVSAPATRLFPELARYSPRPTPAPSPSGRIRPLPDVVGDDAVDANGGEQRREAAEEHERRGVELRPCQRRVEPVCHGLDVEDGDPWIDPQHGVADGGNAIAGVTGHAHDERQVARRPARKEHLRAGGGCWSAESEIPDDADDQSRFALGGDERAAEGGFGRAERPGERFVDDRHRLSVLQIGAGELAPGEDPVPDRAEEGRRDERQRGYPCSGAHLVQAESPAHEGIDVERQRFRCADGDDAGNLTHALDRVAVVRLRAFRRVVGGPRK
jgi:hypothetical protein